MRDRDLETLAFPAVLEALAALAVSEPGREACRRLRPRREAAAAERALDRQWSFYRLAETHGPIPLAAFPDVRESLALASHGDAVLPGDRLVEIRTVLRQAQALQRFFRGQLADFPALADLPSALQSFPELEAALGRMLDDAGALCDGASPQLAELRAALRELRREIEERLDRLVSDSGATDAIAERYVTVRNNRFVVPIKASAAARVAGVVQDRSASGETLFVEPLFAIELNNRLLLVRKEEELEELRLLGMLTAQVGAARDELTRTLGMLAEIDRLAAGAALARRMRATRPVLAERVDLRGARHPELLLAGRTVVPVDIRIAEERRALVLSGPNTGGKSVALKTLGLLTLMAHAGILVPADEGSTVPAVGAVLTDFGDEQSVERDLSTFSSHVVNLVDVFRTLAPPALVLLDEPGVGTDPDEGAALAVALIERLIEAGAFAAVSTHYAPVKLYALNEPRIELAAVEVDRVSFEPRYRLLYGSVGESLGLAMARRLALPAAILAAAEARRDETARALADAISRLETSRRRLEDEHRAVVEERRALAELEQEQASLVAELRERRRARWSADLEDARAFLRALKTDGRALLEVTRRRGPDAARALAEFVRGREEEITRHAAAVAEPESGPERQPVVGDHVEVRGTMIRGELVELGAESARVLRGTITYRVARAELRTLPTTPATPVTPRRHDVPQSAPAELNLIGVRAAEALRRLDRFLDQAQAAGLASVRIVHGLGTGALKRAVAEYLAASAYCSGFHDAAPSDGGAGVTVADLS